MAREASDKTGFTALVVVQEFKRMPVNYMKRDVNRNRKAV
jgi:hypothetical protein